MTMGQPLLIPCRVTHPSLNVSLAKNKLQADQRNIVWNSKRGFTIRRPDYDHIGLLYCQVTVG
ncbi:hypothetical protein CRUP_011061, partial [Coryphaenoides rupestris]